MALINDSSEADLAGINIYCDDLNVVAAQYDTPVSRLLEKTCSLKKLCIVHRPISDCMTNDIPLLIYDVK